MRFKDKAREKQRQATLKQQLKQRQETGQQQQKQQRRRQVEQVSPNHGAGAGAATHARVPRTTALLLPSVLQQPEAHLPAAKRRKQREREEMEELQKDYALLKQLKRGKITAHEFDVAAGLVSDSE